MLRSSGVVVSAHDPAVLLDFYTQVFGDSIWEGPNFKAFRAGNGIVAVGPDDRLDGPAKEPMRVMFNLETDDIDSEFQRIKGLGAEVIAEPAPPSDDPGTRMATFADPEGNYFQVHTPPEAFSAT